MVKKSSRRNSFVVTIPVLAISVAWTFLVFLPIQKSIDQIEAKAEEMRQYCDKANALLPVLQRTSREVAQTREKIEIWNEQLPSRRDLTSLLGSITASARAAGLRTTRFNPEPSIASERIARVPLSMGVTGSFPNLFEFLGKLESMPQCIWIETVEFEKTDKDSQNVSCELTMAIFVDNLKISGQAN